MNHHPEIQAINWPAKECDLNPIENLWAIMLRDWDVGQQRTCDSIERRAIEVWKSIRSRENLHNNLVLSLPERLDEVIATGGGWTSH